ncbi:DUF445 domain-containing protein [Pararobbsia silviterrae]|uniref:DUF445 domain-containing protein n=1 Tax=Pararobbsia silviterrae TaxID=1792498 RepID=A0A494XMV8_9BURK|nr:DUF445 domain-containing protein [Pararobbsia silviterrae]RKP51958.1 DUF445 domain-containing protein [Pararobbsia silviterrae]
MEAPDKRTALNRMKTVATGLLVVSAGLFALAKSHHDAGAWAWLAAFSEAAMVGALADWFAVVALFRRPLGLPIPHTAILPANKARVADNLAAFVRDKFLGTDALVDNVVSFDPAQRLASWLSEPRNAALLGEKAIAATGQMLELIDDDHVKSVLYATLRSRAERFDLAGGVGSLFATLTADNRHQRLLDEGLGELAAWLERPEIQKTLADKIVQIAGDEYPTLIGALGFVGLKAEDLGFKFAGGLVRGAGAWLADIAANPEHERRQAFDRAVARFIERLQSDPSFKQRIDDQKRAWLERPELREYVNGLWDDFTTWLREDIARPDSTLRAKIVSAAASFARTLGDDPVLRASINTHMHEAMRDVAPELSARIARHISTTVREWDDQTLVRDVELNIGRDLQFIRVNGTIVGGLVGLLIHAVSLAIG